MKYHKYLTHFLLIFIVTFIVNALTVYLWNLLQHGVGVFEWDTSFVFAIVLAIVLPIATRLVEKKKK